MMNNTLAQLRELKLVGMATAIEEQLSSTASTALSFEERLALMVDREVHQRADKRHAARLKRNGGAYMPWSLWPWSRQERPEALVDLESLPVVGSSSRQVVLKDALTWARQNAALLATRWKELNP